MQVEDFKYKRRQRLYLSDRVRLGGVQCISTFLLFKAEAAFF